MTISLSIGKPTSQDESDAPVRRGFLCICGIPPGAIIGNDMLHYTTGLLKEVLSASLTNASLYQEARRRSRIDALTGAYTRRLFEEKLQDEHARSLRYGRGFCVGMLDVDHFKRINDTWGHPAGDRVLREVAEVLAADVRSTDLYARYGGDEFVLLMPETDRDEAAAVVERLRQRVRAVRTPGGGPVTISGGIAEWSAESEESMVNLVHRADAALYEAKRSGRDRIVTHAAAPAGA